MHTTASLEELFGDELALGIWYDRDDFARLPCGGFLNHCTSGALWIRSVLGEGEIWGWFDGANPTRHPKILGGHDFLIYRERWIIDPWLSVYRGIAPRTVWDLREDRDELLQYYGDPDTWSGLGSDGFYECKGKWK